MRIAALLILLALPAAAATAVAQQAPARDGVVTPTVGTASISGVVVDDQERPQPVRRAIVTLTGDGLRPSRGAITDDAGKFAIGNLPAGRFNLTVTRAAFVTSMYGAKRPGRPGTPLVVAAGTRVDNLSVRIWRGAVLSGIVRDDTGKPVEGIAVKATSASPGSGGPLLTLSNNGATTNENGEYRIFGLEPGRYVISALPASGGSQIVTMTDAAMDALFEAARRPAGVAPNPRLPTDSAPRPVGYVPVYYPGAVSMAQATPITLGPGQEAGGLDIALRFVATSIVSGTIMRPDGTPAAGATIQLAEDLPESSMAGPPRLLSATSGPDGSFRVEQVTPGGYRVLARASAQAAPPPAATGGFVTPGPVGLQLWASTRVTVAGADLNGLALTVAPGLTVSGRVTYESATLTPPTGGALRVMFVPSSTRLLAPGSAINDIGYAAPATVAADGTFSIASIPPGTYRLMVYGSAVDRTPWSPRSAMMGSRDLLDNDFEIDAGGNATLPITITDRHTAVSGTLQTPAGAPASDVFVIAFPADRARWAPYSRRVSAVRPGIDGGYAISNLPAGDYLLAAVTDVDQDEWQVPGFLDQLVAGAVKFTLADGELRVVNLRIGR